jgi:hypothetical protein
MLSKAIKSIMIRKYYGYKVYFHNFSYFDGVFILKTLVNLEVGGSPVKIETRLRDSRILSLHVKYDKVSDNPEKYKGSFTIMDSLLVLPSSLEKLSEAFKCDNKGMFPLKLLNEVLDGEYSGKVPDHSYFFHPNQNKKPEEYSKFLEKFNNYKAPFENTGMK